MIITAMIVTASGIPIFSKEFSTGAHVKRECGQLFATMVEMSKNCSGMAVTYIEMGELAVTIVPSEQAKVLCALVHHKDDGAAFANLIAKEILHAFIDQYSNKMSLGSIHNLKDFHGFHEKIGDVLRDSVRPVLRKLVLVKGIHKAMLVGDDNRQTFCTADVDELGVVANLMHISGVATDLMAYLDDSFSQISLEGQQGSRILIWRVERSLLVVVVSKKLHPDAYNRPIGKAIEMLRKVFWLI
mmetsp:Transcript_12045/g.15754  ORF Transcript_12045/g.15754 Transcript_12045/m.15754 type:complete len:243 (+) Transcript_12045:117-845(+)|eukprot:CAMPEP_0117754962 /NCGR_PEP_ID=MMETSP0947-20121206/13160_1 /TAXON_ID=44440 /ORGANISM="Chattonella subsalsa, Strain CCMP2191" /LENGTH=242 /DNA_ID=CAMNT_0005574189 /DNA_START=65 /DNA_END=793 /DNA_ORIENTATION=+